MDFRLAKKSGGHVTDLDDRFGAGSVSEDEIKRDYRLLTFDPDPGIDNRESVVRCP